MGFLTIFKKKENKPTDEESIYRTLTIKRLLDDVENLKKENEDFKNLINKLDDINNIKEILNKYSEMLEVNYKHFNKSKTESKQTLTQLEKKVYDTQKKFKFKSYDLLAKKLKLKPGSVRVYFNKIKNKGYNISLNK